MDQTITSLIEKLEGAEVGSRELDVSLAWNRWVEPKLWASTTSKGVSVWKVERQGKRVPLEDRPRGRPLQRASSQVQQT